MKPIYKRLPAGSKTNLACLQCVIITMTALSPYLLWTQLKSLLVIDVSVWLNRFCCKTPHTEK